MKILPKASLISEEKRDNKYYSIDPATVAIMRTHLINMLNRLKHY